jgi:hypothetical protein
VEVEDVDEASACGGFGVARGGEEEGGEVAAARVGGVLEGAVAVPAVADEGEDEGVGIHVFDGVRGGGGFLDQFCVRGFFGVDAGVGFGPEVGFVVEGVEDGLVGVDGEVDSCGGEGVAARERGGVRMMVSSGGRVMGVS